MKMPHVIRLDKLCKRFGAETALGEVSLEVPPGVVFALLGENGAGKTTAIRIMLGLAEPTSGQTEVLGHRSKADGLKIRQRVGYVPERPTLYEWMTVEEIGWFTAGFYAAGFLPEYARLIAQFSLPPKKRLKSLSKGMYAKVVLALALAHQPELLILDEPTSGLDALVRREFLDSMVDRAAQGQTVFLSSHQIVEVERVADIVAILRKGKLLLVEPLEELKARVRRLTVTLKDGVASLPDFCGAGVPPAVGGSAGGTPAPQVLCQRWKARQWQALVRGMSEDQLAALDSHEAVELVEVHLASLEDIFVAYMQGSEQQKEMGTIAGG
jgi:ABC-2 type transport system ATP-binding protein